MRVQRTRTKQVRAPLTTTLGHPKSTQCNFNSCSFNYKSDYSSSSSATEHTTTRPLSTPPHQASELVLSVDLAVRGTYM